MQVRCACLSKSSRAKDALIRSNCYLHIGRSRLFHEGDEAKGWSFGGRKGKSRWRLSAKLKTEKPMLDVAAASVLLVYLTPTHAQAERTNTGCRSLRTDVECKSHIVLCITHMARTLECVLHTVIKLSRMLREPDWVV
eukprot:6190000-Pleurochrysis_carterae.AAC.1